LSDKSRLILGEFFNLPYNKKALPFSMGKYRASIPPKMEEPIKYIGQKQVAIAA
jgi:hypothetical protein